MLQGGFSSDNANPVTGFVEREMRLGSTGVIALASGSASARIESLTDSTRRELLSMSAEGLISNTSYRLIADGLLIGITMARSGFVRVTLTSDGSSGQLLPPLLRPVINIKHIELQDATGRVVLQGNFTPNLVQAK